MGDVGTFIPVFNMSNFLSGSCCGTFQTYSDFISSSASRMAPSLSSYGRFELNPPTLPLIFMSGKLFFLLDEGGWLVDAMPIILSILSFLFRIDIFSCLRSLKGLGARMLGPL